MSFFIREMIDDDLSEVVAIEQATQPDSWNEAIFKSLLETSEAFVMCVDNAVMGFALMRIVLDEAEILTISILPERQGQGLGHQLLQRLIQVAKERKVQKIFLEVRRSNVSAIHLYEKCEFLRMGIRKNYYNDKNGCEDAQTMVLQI